MEVTPLLTINVSELSDWRRIILVAVHELVEVFLCQHTGVSQEEVDAFDKCFEEARERGEHSQEAEPGDDPRCPYQRQHGVASGIERIMAAELGVNWEEYATEIESLP